jgi:hypothetical protein
MGASLTQQPIVDNRGRERNHCGGFRGEISAHGYTLMLTGMKRWSESARLPKVPYDTLKDFAPVTGVAAVQQIRRASGPAGKSLKELADLAKKSPGKLTSASPGIGGISHRRSKFSKGIGRFDIEHVAYKGTAPALTISSAATCRCSSPTCGAAAYVKSGKLRALAVTGGAHRSCPRADRARAGLSAQVTNWISVVVPPRARPRSNGCARLSPPSRSDTRERYQPSASTRTAPSSAAFGLSCARIRALGKESCARPASQSIVNSNRNRKILKLQDIKQAK